MDFVWFLNPTPPTVNDHCYFGGVGDKRDAVIGEDVLKPRDRWRLKQSANLRIPNLAAPSSRGSAYKMIDSTGEVKRAGKLHRRERIEAVQMQCW